MESKKLNLQDRSLQKLNSGIFRDGEKCVRFVESAGVGLISRMMEEMIRRVGYTSKQEKIYKSLEVLLEMMKDQKELDIQLFLDGEHFHDKYLAVEIMNLRYVGPRLLLAPDADPGDGLFDVVLISPKQGEELAKYLSDRLKGIQEPFPLPVYRAEEVKITGRGLHLHVDDQTFHTPDQKEYIFLMDEKATTVLAGEPQV